nr:hypothetical protein [Vulcanisaeta sp. JCM 16159]
MGELGINVDQYKPEPIAVYVKDGELVRWWRGFEDRVREFNRWGLGDDLRAMWGKIVNFHRALRKYMYRLDRRVGMSYSMTRCWASSLN